MLIKLFSKITHRELIEYLKDDLTYSNILFGDLIVFESSSQNTREQILAGNI